MEIVDFKAALVHSDNYILKDWSDNSKEIFFDVSLSEGENGDYMIIKTSLSIGLNNKNYTVEGSDSYYIPLGQNAPDLNAISSELVYQSFCRNAGYISGKFGLLIKSLPSVFAIHSQSNL